MKIPWGQGGSQSLAILAELLNLQKRENAKVIPSRLLRWMGRVVLAAAGDAEIRSTGEGPDCGLGGGEAVGSAPYLLHSSGRGLKSREEVEAGSFKPLHCQGAHHFARRSAAEHAGRRVSWSCTLVLAPILPPKAPWSKCAPSSSILWPFECSHSALPITFFPENSPRGAREALRNQTTKGWKEPREIIYKMKEPPFSEKLRPRKGDFPRSESELMIQQGTVLQSRTIYYTTCCCCYVASVVSDSLRPHRRQPTRLLCPWDFPGKSTVGCNF